MYIRSSQTSHRRLHGGTRNAARDINNYIKYFTALLFEINILKCWCLFLFISDK